MINQINHKVLSFTVEKCRFDQNVYSSDQLVILAEPTQTGSATQFFFQSADVMQTNYPMKQIYE